MKSGPRVDQALVRVVRSFAAAGDPDRLLRTVLEEAVPLVGGDDGGIARWHRADGLLRAAISLRPPTSVGAVLDAERSASGRAAATRRPVIVNDRQRELGAETPAGRAGAEAVVAVPLLHDGDLLGTLSISAYQPGRRFDDRDAEALELLGTMAAAVLVGLERSRFDGAVKAARLVVHEINNRLQLVVGYGEILSGLPPEEVGRAAEQMTAAANEMGEFVGRLARIVRFPEVDQGGGPMLDLEAATEAVRADQG
jgi:hypothetical protein